MTRAFFPSLLLLLLLGLVSGCASYNTNVQRTLQGVTHFFVLANGNDNRALNHQIVATLKARGFSAETGPLTMMPDESQAIITYQDYWTWDFGEHLVYLQISARDRKTSEPFGSVTFQSKLPSGKTTAVIVDGLIVKLLPAGH
jgi:hypothetical protein